MSFPEYIEDLRNSNLSPEQFFSSYYDNMPRNMYKDGHIYRGEPLHRLKYSNYDLYIEIKRNYKKRSELKKQLIGYLNNRLNEFNIKIEIKKCLVNGIYHVIIHDYRFLHYYGRKSNIHIKGNMNPETPNEYRREQRKLLSAVNDLWHIYYQYNPAPENYHWREHFRDHNTSEEQEE
jgi:hypothetical protein